MSSKNNRFYVAVCIAFLVTAFGWLIINWYSNTLDRQFDVSYDKGDLSAARAVAERLGWFDEKNSAHMLAIVAITESAVLIGKQGDDTIDRALAKLEKQGSYGEDDYWVLLAKATLASLLGDATKAKRYFHEACDLNSKEVIPNDAACLSDVYQSSRRAMFRSSSFRSNAFRFYEAVEVADVAGGIDHDDLAFDRVLIMIAFNKDMAFRMRDELAKEGRMTPKRVEEFERLIANGEKPFP